MSEYSAFLFDFDGVIFDTEKYHFLAWKKSFAQFGMQFTEEEYQPLKSTGRDSVSRYAEFKRGLAFSAEERQKLIEVKARAFENHVAHISPSDFIDGAVEFVKGLKERGYKTAVGSSGSITKKIIDRFNLGGCFDAVVDGSANLPKKPSPEIFLSCADMLGAKPKECLVFEDSLAGLNSAISAGMDCVSVGGIHFPGAVYNIKDFSGLVQKLKRV